MNVLFIVPYVPNQIRVRPYNLIRQLVEHGHGVTVVAPWHHPAERDGLAALEALGIHVETRKVSPARVAWNCLRAIPTGMPLQANYSWQPDLAERTRELAVDGSGMGPYDIVHVEHLRGARYGLLLKQASLSRGDSIPPIVWDSVDSIGYLFRQASKHSRRRWSRWVTSFEQKRSARYERWLLSQFDHVLVTSRKDQEELGTTNLDAKNRSPVSILANGVDPDAFHPPADGSTRIASDVVVSGKMSYHANVSMVLHLVEDIMPMVWAERPDIRLLVVGKDPPSVLRSLAKNPRIVVTGWVPKVAEYLQNASLSLTPLTYGAGIQNKVLEAMACATPVVAYPKAVASMEVQDGREAILPTDPAQFAAGTLKLLANPESRRRIGNAGHRYIRRHHDWSSLGSRLEEIYDDVIHTPI
jgi:glycosyltransferase involved in cell wall biosynthesis